MKKRLLIFFYCITSAFSFVYSKPNLNFELVTDKKIKCEPYIDMDKLRDNVLVVVENGKITDKYYSKHGYPIVIESIQNSIITIKTFIDNSFINYSCPPFLNHFKTLLSYSDGSFKEVFSCAELIDNQSGPNISIESFEYGPNEIEITYKYTKNGQAKYEGYGTISLELEKICDFYYLNNYICNVKGYFKYFDKEAGEASPVHDITQADFTVDRDIQKQDFISLIFPDDNRIICDTSSVNRICHVTENLRLRKEENTSSEIVTLMKTGTCVNILKIGRRETIDNKQGRWCYVETIEQKNLNDSNMDMKYTGFNGWCFSGYLE